MNVKNLERTIEMLKGIPQERFDMELFRESADDEKNQHCGTVGCIVGHATSLDKPENLIRFKYFGDGSINFVGWSEEFYGLKNDYEKYSVWNYLFSDAWARHKELNTPQHAIYRIQRIIDGHKPSYNLNDEFTSELLIYQSNETD